MAKQNFHFLIYLVFGQPKMTLYPFGREWRDFEGW